ncbi:hypothetical protein Tco_1390137 [Tanacetum coccineum]
MEAESNSGMIKSSDGQNFENDGFDSGNMDGNKYNPIDLGSHGNNGDINHVLEVHKLDETVLKQSKLISTDNTVPKKLNNNFGIIVDPNYDTKENQSELNVGTNQPKTWKRRARERVENSLNNGTNGDIHGGKRTYEDCNSVGDRDVDIMKKQK